MYNAIDEVAVAAVDGVRGSDQRACLSVGVVGGSGYTGRELLRRLSHHPGAPVAFAFSQSEDGHATACPGLAYTPPDLDRVSEADVVFLCLPHGTTAPWHAAAAAAGARVVDLTADRRPGAANPAGAVYGLAEWNRQEISQAQVVANPGCYPTGVLTALLPLKSQLSGLPITIYAASGVTGAGRSPKRDLLFAELAGDFRPYGVGNDHRHLIEMRALLDGADLLFLPHLLPVERGIVETIVLPVRPGVGAADVRAVWNEAYRDSTIIQVAEKAPSLRQVSRSDLLILSATDNPSLTGYVTIVLAFDNLGKGAAGQAIQNFNLMSGQEIDRGLICAPS